MYPPTLCHNGLYVNYYCVKLKRQLKLKNGNNFIFSTSEKVFVLHLHSAFCFHVVKIKDDNALENAKPSRFYKLPIYQYVLDSFKYLP